MRDITIETMHHFRQCKKFKKSNTRIEVTENLVGLYLFDNLIALKDRETNEIKFTLAGWNSVTTRERLQAIGVQISSKQWTPYYNGKAINTNEWYQVEVA